VGVTRESPAICNGEKHLAKLLQKSQEKPTLKRYHATHKVSKKAINFKVYVRFQPDASAIMISKCKRFYSLIRHGDYIRNGKVLQRVS
jgi:hypothetical protein